MMKKSPASGKTSRDKKDLASRATKRQASSAEMAAHDRRNAVVMGLNVAIVAVSEERPRVLVVRPNESETDENTWDALPFGPFDPAQHRTLEIGMRSWVEEQTGLSLGYVEQLYTFGDRGRYAPDNLYHRGNDSVSHVVSVVYLALTRIPETVTKTAAQSTWPDWYRYFPWEDWRNGRPAIIDDAIAPLLKQWAQAKSSKLNRARICFGLNLPWDEEKVLERYELLYEAGLVAEAQHDRGQSVNADKAILGEPMQFDHRRILATAMARLRGKLKYRPVVFELMPPQFTLLELQRAVEAVSGSLLHKQNFRRLVEKGGLVERTGQFASRTGGRPAELFRFRRDVLLERPAPGLRVTVSRQQR